MATILGTNTRRRCDTGDYQEVVDRAASHPGEFWLDAAKLIDWQVSPSVAVEEQGAGLFRWFPDGVLNTCYNAVDRHVAEGHGDRVAIIYDSPVTGTQLSVTYNELWDLVSRFAGVLADAGVGKGDRVIIYLPMIPEAIVAMLAAARLGAVHSVVFGGFAARELASRLDDAQPAAIVTASGGIEPSRLVEYLPTVVEAMAMATHQVASVIVKERLQIPGSARDFQGGSAKWLDWDEQMRTASPRPPVPVAASDPLYILYTSGTTGAPKGVVRDNGGHAVAMAWSMRNIYGITPGDVMWAASDVGWVVGHSYIVYAPLIAGATTLLYEGKPVGTPDAGAFWRVASEHRVKVLFTAPTALRAIRKADPDALLMADHDLSSLDALFMAGERLDPDTWTWASESLGIPVIDHWWQTETGWPICSSPRGIEEFPLRPGSASFPSPGFGVKVVGAAGSPVGPNVEGNIVITLPLPPGALLTLWGSDQRYIDSYLSAFPGNYLTGDSGYFDEDGYLFVMGRTDDVINVAGHRLSTGSLEQVVAAHPAVAECAVIGVADQVKGQVPMAFVVLKAGRTDDPAALREELIGTIRREIGSFAAPRRVVAVTALPKTRSGKTLRKTMRQIVEGVVYAVPPTIEDPSALAAIELAVNKDADAVRA